jgi:hypothetical protein
VSFKVVIFIFTVCLAPGVIKGQAAGGGGTNQAPGRVVASMGFAGSAMPMMQVTGAPFSGTREMEHTQTLADGTHITQKNQIERIFRDTEGRTRTERTMFFGMASSKPDIPTIVQISDPIAGFRVTLDSQNKVAHHIPAVVPSALKTESGLNQQASPARGGGGGGGGVLSGPNGQVGSAISIAPPPVEASRASRRIATLPPNSAQTGPGFRRQIQHESLGTKTINGILVNGSRTTSTIPEGAQGNDRPIKTVSESWISPDLKEVIESTTLDPRNGESISRLVDIELGNPDPSLFEIPADYQVVDEQGAFNIQFTAPR